MPVLDRSAAASGLRGGGRDPPARQIEPAAAARCGGVRGVETPVVFSVMSSRIHVIGIAPCT